MDRLRELIGAFKAQEISKDDFNELVTTLVQIVQMVQEALNAPDGVEISVNAGEDSKMVDEAMEIVNVEREQKAFQNFLEIQEEEKQVDALGQYGLEEFLEPGEDPNLVEEFTDAEDGEEEEIQGDVSQRQFGLKEFSSRNLDLPAKGTLVSFVLKWLQAGRSFQTDRELAIFSVKLFWWTMEAGNINSLMENLRKGEG